MSQVLVIGGGLAGLRTALAARAAGATVSLLSKVQPLSSHSIAATGGINAALSSEDSWEQHVADVLAGSVGLADRDAVEKVCREAATEVRQLEQWGTPFNRDAAGRLGVKAIGGNTRARLLFAGEHTGKALLQALWQRCVAEGIEMEEDIFLLRLATENGRCCGAVVLDSRTGEIQARPARAVVLATGGLGQVYQPTTNAMICTGDGTAAAFRVGALLQDMEMTQFYPTCFVGTGVCVTEEARSRGAVLVNRSGRRFMERYAPDAMEMANRDILSRAIFTELLNGEEVLLDCRPVGKEELSGGLSAFAKLARSFGGVDVTSAPLPVVPGFHYQMGGISTDLEGQTTVPGLYAAGECACVSVHGANRVGGNSLLETLVMGRAAGVAASQFALGRDDNFSPVVHELAKVEKEQVDANLTRSGDGFQVGMLRKRLGKEMMAQAGIVRNETGLRRGAEILSELDAAAREVGIGDPNPVFNQSLRRLLELQNLILLGRVVVASARAREESRGAHFRQDFPALGQVPLHTRAELSGADKVVIEFAPVRS